MDKPKAEFYEQLRVLQRAYSAELQGKLGHIQEIWNKLHKGTWNADLLKTLHAATHSITGSAATFGFNLLSNAARKLEIELQHIIESGLSPTNEQKKDISRLIPIVIESAANQYIGAYAHNYIPPCTPRGGEGGLIFLVEDALELAEHLALQISRFGYSVKTFSSPIEMELAMGGSIPSAIIMDVMFPEGDFAGPDIAAKIRGKLDIPIPIIFISAKNDFVTRMRAIRAGGDAFFAKPLDIIELVERLDILTFSGANEPYRILVVDDETSLADHLSLLLKQAGMTTAVVTNPVEIIKQLIEFNPDLILMDIYMDECNGLEVAAIIRQMKEYVSLPIVFLSVETAVRKQLDAMRLGGDDFLTKPVDPGRLISLVMSRAERGRILSSSISHDAMTGLFNHNAIISFLEREIARAKRQGSSLSLALIDIDNFKQVNDTYGHLTGDRILRSLTMHLVQRLRITDTIGRYGGDEFVVILPDTDAQSAIIVIDEVRKAFAEIHKGWEDIGSSITFSAGIADFPRYNDGTALIAVSDKALYKAKQEGRNTVILADG